jgi:nucleoside-diphosphate-sugar epimerase
MKVLFVGGTGQISFDCVHASVRAGHQVSVFNRGSNNAGFPPEVSFITGDVEDDDAYGRIAEMGFDVICQFRVFTPKQLQRDVELLAGRVGQYIFISSASAYQKPTPYYLITEAVPLENPFSDYSRNKAACEAVLREQTALPYTIVRPSHTSRTKFTTAMGEGDLAASRMLRGRPIIVPGDGTSLWTVTRSQDFAPPFVKLFGQAAALGEAFHLTSPNAYDWNHIYRAIGKSLGVEPDLVHVPTDTLIKYHPAWEAALLGDKSNSVVFDNSKIKALVGDFTCNPSLDLFMEQLAIDFNQRGGVDLPIDAELDALYDRIAADQRAVGPGERVT